MRVFIYLMLCGSLLSAPILMAKQSENNKQVFNHQCDEDEKTLDDLAKDFTVVVQNLMGLYSESAWADDSVLDIIEDLEGVALRLERKLQRGVGEARIAKHFGNIQEVFTELGDEMECIIEEIENDCRKNKASECKIGKRVRNTFYDLEDAFADVQEKI